MLDELARLGIGVVGVGDELAVDGEAVAAAVVVGDEVHAVSFVHVFHPDRRINMAESVPSSIANEGEVTLEGGLDDGLFFREEVVIVFHSDGGVGPGEAFDVEGLAIHSHLPAARGVLEFGSSLGKGSHGEEEGE